MGVFTERDVMIKIVLEKRSAEATHVGQVMTAPAVTIEQNADMSDALQIMIDRHIRHLPVTDHEGKVVGMLSMRHLMREQIEALKLEVGSLANYIGSDGPGG
jgi:CBS domain-containing protein